MPREAYALIAAQKMMGVNDAALALRFLLEGKYGHLSLMMHLGVRIDNEQFGNSARHVCDVEAVVAQSRREVEEARQMARLDQLAQEANLDPDLAKKFLTFIILEVIRHHENLQK